MKIDSATDFAVMGMQRALQGTREAASQIASTGQMTNENPADLAKAMVDLRSNETQAKASAEIIKTQDTMIGSLFDDKA